jgi:hypothetical protein
MECPGDYFVAVHRRDNLNSAFLLNTERAYLDLG